MGISGAGVGAGAGVVSGGVEDLPPQAVNPTSAMPITASRANCLKGMQKAVFVISRIVVLSLPGRAG